MPSNTLSRLHRESGPTRIIAALKLHGLGPKWSTHCPAHEDSSPSLSVQLAQNGNLLLKCHVGCSMDAILAALGAPASDLFATQVPTQPEENASAIYNYTDEDGTLLYQVLRYPDKAFKQRRRNRDGSWL